MTCIHQLLKIVGGRVKTEKCSSDFGLLGKCSSTFYKILYAVIKQSGSLFAAQKGIKIGSFAGEVETWT